MVKVFLFAVLVLGVMFYPMLMNEYKVVNTKKTLKTLPDVEFDNGKFYIYNGRLEKQGSFKTLDLYKNNYVALKLNVKDLKKEEEYKADKTVFKDNIVTGYGVFYKNRDLELITNLAYYNKITKILNGGKFKLFSKDFKGYGDSFTVDSKRNLTAENITYYLKVVK